MYESINGNQKIQRDIRSSRRNERNQPNKANNSNNPTNSNEPINSGAQQTQITEVTAAVNKPNKPSQPNNLRNSTNPISPINPTNSRRIASDVTLGNDVVIQDFVNLYGCTIGDQTRIGPFVEVQKNAFIGKRCKVQSHTFICEGVTIGDDVFVGHGVMFINDKYPRATNNEGGLQSEADWQVVPTVVKDGASIGSNATILCGITIGEKAIVGAGAVVIKDVPDNTIVAGNPARVLRKL